MEFGVDCYQCLFSKECKRVASYPEQGKMEYLHQVSERLFRADVTQPEMQHEIDLMHRAFWGNLPDVYHDLKNEHTGRMLEQEQYFETMVLNSTQPLKLAVKIAAAGNYIDVAAMDHVSIPDLLSKMQAYIDAPIDEIVFAQFCADLSKARNLVYLTDNCGEVVLDKVLLRQLKRQFPALSMCAIVKGGATFNDVTPEDAHVAGLDEIVPILDSGIGIPGTCLHTLQASASQAIVQADVMIAKGQGNFETLSGCGLNIYYLFLCKCKPFIQALQVAPMERVFVHESDYNAKK